MVRKPIGPQPPNTEIREGSWVLYWSRTSNRYVHSHVRQINDDGTLDLNTKSRAKREDVKLPHVQQVPPKPPRAKNPKTTKAKPKAAPAAAAPAEDDHAPPEDENEGPEADAIFLDGSEDSGEETDAHPVPVGAEEEEEEEEEEEAEEEEGGEHEGESSGDEDLFG